MVAWLVALETLRKIPFWHDTSGITIHQTFYAYDKKKGIQVVICDCMDLFSQKINHSYFNKKSGFFFFFGKFPVKRLSINYTFSLISVLKKWGRRRNFPFIDPNYE